MFLQLQTVDHQPSCITMNTRTQKWHTWSKWRDTHLCVYQIIRLSYV